LKEISINQNRNPGSFLLKDKTTTRIGKSIFYEN